MGTSEVMDTATIVATIASCAVLVVVSSLCIWDNLRHR